MLNEERWYRLKGDDAASRVVAIATALEKDVGDRHKARWERARIRYENRNLEDNVTSEQELAITEDAYNLSRSGVDSAHAEIAARQRPKPMFVTVGGDWRTRRKAKKLDRFVEACMSDRQGDRYSDIWELAEDVFRDAECAVGGVIKVGIDVEREKITYDRVPAYEVLVDPQESRAGRVRNWFQSYPMDLDIAEATFADGGKSETGDDLDDEGKNDIRAKLMSAAGKSTDANLSAAWRAMQSVQIFEAWYISPIKGKPGRHVVACRAGVLVEEDWHWPRSPFAVLVWSKEPFGIWGTGLVEAGALQHDMVNELQRRLWTRLKLNASRRTYFVPGLIDSEQMGKNEAEVFVPVKDMAQCPRSEELPPISAAEAEMLQTEMSRWYDLQGISQMGASQRKDPGVDAAVAMQTLNDIKSVRFLPKARAYELLFVDLGELTILAARDLAKAKPSFTAKWSNGSRQLDEIKWADVSLDDMPTVKVAPVSAMSRDPAQRLEIVQQLTGMGFLSRERYLELLNMPDLDSVLQAEGSETAWIDKMCDRYLDAEDDDELEKLGGYQEPDGYLTQPVAALVTVAQHYFDAMVNNVPEYNADLMIRFMSSLQRIIQKAPGQQAAQNAAPAQVAQALTPEAAPMPMAA